MGDFFAELKRRHIYRVGAAYAVVAWVLLQLVTNVAPVLDLPIWVARAFLLALIIGFPITLLFAWMRELAPADGTAPRAVTGKSDWVLAGGLAVIIALVSYQQLAPPRGERAVPVAPAGVDKTTRAAAASVPAGVSIAVLPFDNLSGDAAQEFFSDGMTEEITTALAKVPDLRVVGRTSAYQFKGKSQDLRAIGQALAVTHLIEGSVRKAGNRVRITAQLIKVDDGTHIWAENYDRQLTDIFAIQEDIATAIAGALRLPLGLPQGERLVSNRTIDPELYQQFLRARTILRSRNQTGAATGDRFAGAIAMLEQVVARDPGYAPAWTLIAAMSNGEKKEMAAREAVRLDPRSAAGYAALAGIQAGQGNRAVVEDLLKQALAVDPNEPDILDGFSNQLALAGRLKEALTIREKLRTLEPFVPVYNYITASIMLIAGQSKAAIPILEALPAAPPRDTVLAQAYAAEGRYGEAANTLLAIKGENRIRGAAEEAARLLRNAPSKVQTPDALPAFDQSMSFVYLYVGAPERVLDYQERQAARYPRLGASEVRYLWGPEFSVVRKTERFKTFVRKMSFVEYWRAKGWPDVCHPIGADDFACD